MKRIALALLCIALGYAIAASVSTGGIAWGQPEKEPADANFNGRFRIVMRDNIRADTYLLDTSTGRTWREFQIPDVAGQPSVWAAENRFDDIQSEVQWYTAQPKTASNGVANPLAAPGSGNK